MMMEKKILLKIFSTYTKIGTLQRRLTWPLCWDDTQSKEKKKIEKSFQGKPAAQTTEEPGAREEMLGRWLHRVQENMLAFHIQRIIT